jgi:hypothetical protein
MPEPQPVETVGNPAKLTPYPSRPAKVIVRFDPTNVVVPMVIIPEENA